jgi:hypothetical protein
VGARNWTHRLDTRPPRGLNPHSASGSARAIPSLVMKGSPVRVRASAPLFKRFCATARTPRSRCVKSRVKLKAEVSVRRDRLDRTQEVAGSSPASSIHERPAIAGLLFSTGGMKTARIGPWSSFGQVGGQPRSPGGRRFDGGGSSGVRLCHSRLITRRSQVQILLLYVRPRARQT